MINMLCPYCRNKLKLPHCCKLCGWEVKGVEKTILISDFIKKLRKEREEQRRESFIQNLSQNQNMEYKPVK